MRKLILIDANSIIHRCFHALPPLSNSKAQPTGGLYGLSTVLLKILREQKPDFITGLFDRPEPTFRKQIFNEYKIHRPKAPDELIYQIIESRNLFEAFGIRTFETPGFEADDLIGTAVEKFKNVPDLKIIILTGDLDALQLIENGNVAVETFKKGVSETMIYDAEAVKTKLGVAPEQVIDYKGLVGDKSDNIPGVPGIGPKTAVGIIKKYGNLENFLKKGKEEKSYPKILSMEKQALMSKELASIRRDAPMDLEKLEELSFKEMPRQKLGAYFEKMEFKTLAARLNSLF
jgi:DNA polymerase-1